MEIPYISNTDQDRSGMLKIMGLDSVDQLFEDVPRELRYPALDLPPPLSEIELRRVMGDLAEANVNLDKHLSLLGAGAYRHFVPAVVDHIISRSEFLTAYGLPDAEMHQGFLQALYEGQRMVCELMAMPAGGAPLYDGATAMAEASLMACRATGRDYIAVGSNVHPEYQQTLATYAWGSGRTVKGIPYDSETGLIDAERLEELLPSRVSCFIVQHPNFFGCLEDLPAIAESVHSVGGLFIVVCSDPTVFGALEAPGNAGADIVAAEGQSLGNPTSFGGPGLGILTCRSELLGQMPGYLFQMSLDAQGKPIFTMGQGSSWRGLLSGEEARSNISTSQVLIGLAATVYLAALGSQGLSTVAHLCYSKAHYAAERITSIEGVDLRFKAPFYNEFVMSTPLPPSTVSAKLFEHRIIGGYGLDQSYSELGDCMLISVTEVHNKNDIERLVRALEEIISGGKG